jgi:hypothetical protein
MILSIGYRPVVLVASLLAIIVLSSSSSLIDTAYAAGTLINLSGLTINIPITIIIPITINAQNAQICASAATTGPQTCQQIVLNPSQNSFNPISVDLTQPTPTITASPATGATTTTPPPTTTTPPPTTTTPPPTTTTPPPTTTTPPPSGSSSSGSGSSGGRNSK